MKTRIIHTKFWEDEVVAELSPNSKYLFIYFFTNYRIGLTGAYQIPSRVISFETGLDKQTIEKCKKELQDNNRVRFQSNWVYVVNSRRLGGYHGERLQPAVENEYNKIPQDIIDTLLIPYPYTMDTTRNHKEEIINKKEEEIDIEAIDFKE